MRSFRLFLLLVLLLPALTVAQDETPPVIGVYAALRDQNIYTVSQDEAPTLLVDADTPQLVLSPDGEKVAVLDFPAFVQAESQLEPGYYPSDLSVIDVNTGAKTALLTHDPAMTLSSTTGDQFYNGDYSGGVTTQAAWDDPNSIGGGRLTAFLAWSPEGGHIAQVQTVVTDGQYPGKPRLVVYDVASGEMSVITDLGDYGTGFAVFWFEDGIVLYTDVREGSDSVTVYSTEGEVLHQWQLETRTLGHENPVRYEGRYYLAFPQWTLLDVMTGEFMPVAGTIAVVSAANPGESLVLEACNNRDELRPAWDVYSASGEKLTHLEHLSTPTLSPDGSTVVYVDYDADRTMMHFDGIGSQPVTETRFSADSVLWGATIYTLTTVGADECGRTARG